MVKQLEMFEKVEKIARGDRQSDLFEYKIAIKNN